MTLTMQTQNIYTTDHHNTGKGTVTAPKVTLTPAPKVYSISIDPTDSSDTEDSQLVTQKLRQNDI